MKVTIVGIGLIGGSLSIDLKKTGFADLVVGVDKNPEHANYAMKHNLVDRIETLDKAIINSDLIILTTPVDVSLELLPYILNRVTYQIVTDMGSTKLALVQSVQNHPNRLQYVAAHPMAGTEFTGPSAAFSGLFKDKRAIICDQKDSSRKAVEMVKSMFEMLNMKISYLNSDEHDEHAAYISHISHISSFVLALSVLEKEEKTKNIFEMAGDGFASTVRLANSNSTMWEPIMRQNKKNILEVIKTYEFYLQKFKTSIENEDSAEIHQLIKKANQIKDLINFRL